MPDATLLNSRLADTAPALIGVVAILAILLPFIYRLSRMQASVLDRQAAATDKLADAVDRLKTVDDQRAERHYEVLHCLAEQCNASHTGHDNKLDKIIDITTRIEHQLPKALGAIQPPTPRKT
jgi:hypothetical protein